MAITALFTVSQNGQAVDADATPTGVCYVNGTATADTVTVSKLSTGRYKASVNPANVDSGDLVEVVVAVAVDGLTQERVAVREQAVSILEAIQAKTDNIGSAAVTYSSPMAAGGDATIYAGQGHGGANALTWSISDWSGPSLAGNTAKLRLQPLNTYNRAAASRVATYQFNATVSQVSTAVSVSVSLTDAQTSTLTPGIYKGQVVATVAGEDTIVVDCTVTVEKALDAPAA